MASSRDRQRALARAKLERQMARRAAEARRRRQIQAGIGAAVALALVVLGAFWAVNEFGGDDAKKKTGKDKAASSESKKPGKCKFTDVPAKEKKANKKLEDVGKPKAGEEARKGVRVLTLNTNRGTIKIELDAAKAPCNTESLAYLTEKKFYDDSECHRLTDEGIYVLQCGDPTGSGQGGPMYKVNDENLPIGENPAYPKGVVAMANVGQPDTASSQFFIMHRDTQLPAQYTIVGKVTEGLKIVLEVAKGGHDNSMAKTAGGGKPKKPLKIKTATVTEPEDESAE